MKAWEGDSVGQPSEPPDETQLRGCEKDRPGDGDEPLQRPQTSGEEEIMNKVIKKSEMHDGKENPDPWDNDKEEPDWHPGQEVTPPKRKREEVKKEPEEKGAKAD